MMLDFKVIVLKHEYKMCSIYESAPITLSLALFLITHLQPKSTLRKLNYLFYNKL